MTADSVPDNLDEAQRLANRASANWSAATLEMAKTLALIDIGRSLRSIHDELRSWDTYGLTVKKKEY
jgi:hypothetical protein